MKWFVLFLILFSVTSASAMDFRGIKTDGNIKDAMKIIDEIRATEVVQGDNNFLFATYIKEKPVRITVFSDQGKITQLLFRFSRSNYQDIKDALIEKFGGKFDSQTTEYSNRFGAKFIFEEAMWSDKSGVLRLYEKSELDDLESMAIMASKKYVKKLTEKQKQLPGF